MRSTLITAIRNPISAIGVALTTASACLFVLLAVLASVGLLANPYAGLVVFVLMPVLFIFGLLLIPIGLWHERSRIGRGHAAPAWPKLDLNVPSIRNTVIFLLVATLVNLCLVSMASYGAVRYTDSQAFCGETCHQVMAPEFTAHQLGAHGRVRCVECHVGPGAGGFVTAKLNGTRQLVLTLSGRYSRPIPAPLDTMPDVRTTCEQCHQPDRYIGDVIKVVNEYADDAANTQTKTTLRLHVGGPVGGTGSGTGIHWHMNRANQIDYVALDDQREQIADVRVTTPGGTVREYFAKGVMPGMLAGRQRVRMGCLDCHSRPAHAFGTTPERAVDAALGEGLIDGKIPFIRREAVRALRVDYPSQDVGLAEIDRSMRQGMKTQVGLGVGEADLQNAIAATQGIYRRSVFPSMKISWGTYTDELGHTTSAGCFRCHDEDHKTREGAAIHQGCDSCHSIE